ncbi:MAG: PRC-barrel domain containing protein [Anaerolineae bacterium]|nr:PRC-barrel domain containing protein [Anaerolineae bacterium]
MKDIPLKAKVICGDGHGGSVTAVIVNPVAEEMTHIVVQDEHLADHLVPLALVAETSEKEIQLTCTKAELEMLPAFTEKHFMPVAPEEYAMYQGGRWMSPYVVPLDTMTVPVDEENVPPGELAIHRGTDISATDGHVGVLDEFIINPENGHVTHFVLRKGHLWGKHEIAIPLSAIDHTEYDTVYLNIDKDAVKALPPVSVKRNYS